MRLMHTPLPVYVAKMHDAAGGKALTIKGIEGWESAKCASVKTGRIEEAIKNLASDESVCSIEMDIIDACPEVMKTVLLKCVDENGNVTKIVRVTSMAFFVRGEEAWYGDCNNIVPLGGKSL